MASVKVCKVKWLLPSILLIVAFIILLQWVAFHPDTIIQNRYLSTGQFDGFNNISGVEELIVPNIVHYVVFEEDTLDFTFFLSILSVLKLQRPEKVIIHSDNSKFVGHYWEVLQSLPNSTIEIKHRSIPTHVFGQPLSSVYHASDVARIQVLMEYGGIYLDTDTLVLRSLDHFRHFEMVVGWPNGSFIGTQVLIAHKDARFLPMWINCYRNYHPREWYYNAGQLPTESVLEKDPSLVHRVPFLFGVQNLAAQLYGVARWPHWRRLFTVHLLKRHPPAPRETDENFVRHSRTPYGEIARWILYKLEPVSKYAAN